MVNSSPAPLVCVYKDPKMAPFKKHACDAQLKLSHAVERENRAAAREFNIGADLRQVKTQFPSEMATARGQTRTEGS